MATIYYDKDADLGLITRRKVAIIGYGSQGHAHALNLQDSGATVRRRPAGPAAARAKRPRPRGSASRASPTPPPGRTSSWSSRPTPGSRRSTRPAIAPHLTAGKMLMFAHGFNIRFGTIVPPADVDVTMVAPKSPGHRVREVYQEGGGHAGAARHPPGRHGPGEGGRALLREGHRRHAGRGDRDDVQPRKPKRISSASRPCSAAA